MIATFALLLLQQPVQVAGHTLTVPSGFNISVFAEGLRGIRYLTVGPRHDVYASIPRDGRVVRFEGSKAVDYATGLNQPFGLAWRGDTLYVGDQDALIRIDLDGKKTQLVDLPSGGNHVTRTVLIKGDHIYVSARPTCNICDESDPRRPAVTIHDL